MSDPMDTPPEDYGSDRYNSIELVGAPPGVEPEPALVSWYDRHGCLDCNPNFVYHYRPASPSGWHVQVAHDDGCPSLAQHEREGTAQSTLTSMPRETMNEILKIAHEHDPDVIGVVVLHGSPERHLAMSAWSSFEGDDAQELLFRMVQAAFKDEERS
jgi:hypothetical protein